MGTSWLLSEKSSEKHLRRYKTVSHFSQRQSLILISIIFGKQQTGLSYIIYNVNLTQNLHQPLKWYLLKSLPYAFLRLSPWFSMPRLQ